MSVRSSSVLTSAVGQLLVLGARGSVVIAQDGVGLVKDARVIEVHPQPTLVFNDSPILSQVEVLEKKRLDRPDIHFLPPSSRVLTSNMFSLSDSSSASQLAESPLSQVEHWMWTRQFSCSGSVWIWSENCLDNSLPLKVIWATKVFSLVVEAIAFSTP